MSATHVRPGALLFWRQDTRSEGAKVNVRRSHISRKVEGGHTISFRSPANRGACRLERKVVSGRIGKERINAKDIAVCRGDRSSEPIFGKVGYGGLPRRSIECDIIGPGIANIGFVRRLIPD